MRSRLYDRLKFYYLSDSLRTVRRGNWIHAQARKENAAEHSWHATVLAMLFTDAAPANTDTGRVRDLLVVHDLVEVYAGDTPIWDDALVMSEAEREEAATQQLLELLPGELRPRFGTLWREYHAQLGQESRFARAIDSLHPLILSWAEGGHGRSDGTLTPRHFVERKSSIIAPYPLLWAAMLRVLHGAVNRGALPSDDVITGGGNIGIDENRLPDLDRRLTFFLVSDRLKELDEENQAPAYSRKENMAEHSWHVMLLAMLLADAAPAYLDHDRVGDLLAVHNLAMVRAADITQPLEISRSPDPDSGAIEPPIFLIPGKVRERFEALIHEFRAQETEEARFALAIEHLHSIIPQRSQGGFGRPAYSGASTWLVKQMRTALSDYAEL